MIRFISIFCFFIFLLCTNTFAQNVRMFTSEQGLSNSCVRNIYEDSHKNIWITTQNGLNRYDGVKINVYRHDDNNKNSLLQDESTCVFQLDEKCALVGTGYGLQLYNYADDKFKTIPFTNENGDTLTARVVDVFKAENRFFVAFAGYGLGELKNNNDGNYYLDHCYEFNIDNIAPMQLLNDTQDNIWVLSANNKLEKRTKDKSIKFTNLNNTIKLCLNNDGIIYAATENNGVYKYDQKTKLFVQVVSPDQLGGLVTDIETWTKGRLFICTDGAGLKILDTNNNVLTSSKLRTNDFSLEKANVKCALSDSFGNVWVGVYLKGVMMKPINQSAFEYIGHNSITKNTIGYSAVSAMDADEETKKIYVATDNDGIYVLNPDGSSSLHFSKDLQPDAPRGFNAIQVIDRNNVLLGSYSDGLWMLSNGRFSLINKNIDKIIGLSIAADNGCFWISTIGGGFYFYNHNTKEFIHYSNEDNNGNGTGGILGNVYVFSTLQVDDMIFVGTADGIYVCKVLKNGIIKENGKKFLNGLKVVNLVLADDKKHVWAATNNGLVKIDINSLDTKYYKIIDGLPSNNIKAIAVNGKRLWIGTWMGMSMMNVENESFLNYYASDGIQDNEFSTAAVTKLDEFVYLGGIGGITFFNTNSIREDRPAGQFKIKFTDVLVGGKTVHADDFSGGYQILTDLIEQCQRIDLSHSDNRFAIELCVPGIPAGNIVYEYSINGGKWIDQGSTGNRIVFDNLNPGKYDIRIRAKVMGQMSEEKTLTAIVHSPWYWSTWTKCIYFLLFLALAWLVYAYVKRRVEALNAVKKQKQQEELNEARIQFFMNISHEIRTPMTLILAPLNKLISSDGDEERQHHYSLIKQNSNRILRLVNQMMDVRKIEQGKFLLSYGKVDIVAFVRNIFDVFATTATSRNIQYEFKHNIDSCNVFIDPSNTDKILMNLLSNAFKFTPDNGNIQVMLNVRKYNFEVKVIDSGCGISDEDKPKVFERFYSASHNNGYIGTGIGLNLTSMLVKLHSGTISVEDNPDGKGTVFVVNMPVGDESLLNTPFEDNTDKEIHKNEDNDVKIIKPADTKHKNLIIVEDDEAIRQYVQSELAGELVVKTCANGQEAWDYIITHPEKVDIVLSDIMMPVMNGLTLCQKIKSNFNTNHIPVVLMTALGSDADKITGLTNGADAYITKPFNIDILKTVVVQQLKTRHMLQGKFHAEKQREEKIDKVEVESPDENLMRRVMKVVNENISNPDLSVEMIADKVGISRVHFYRKMKELTGQSPRDFVKYLRLKEAGRLLAEKKMDITGVSIATGFKSLSAFSTNFKTLFGLSPTEYSKKYQDE